MVRRGWQRRGQHKKLMEPHEIKRHLNKTVTVPDGIRYKLTGATIQLNEKTGEYWYQAELQDLSALHSIRICKLEDVEVTVP